MKKNSKVKYFSNILGNMFGLTDHELKILYKLGFDTYSLQDLTIDEIDELLMMAESENYPRKFYVAYGSNLNIRQMNFRCPFAKIAGVSVIKDYELLFKTSKSGSYLTIEKKKDSIVPVAVWEVTKFDEESLDFYEGCPTFYYKKKIDIMLNDKKVEAFTYIMHENRPFGIPTMKYVQKCKRGYQDFGFNVIKLCEAIFNTNSAIMKNLTEYKGA